MAHWCKEDLAILDKFHKDNPSKKKLDDISKIKAKMKNKNRSDKAYQARFKNRIKKALETHKDTESESDDGGEYLPSDNHEEVEQNGQNRNSNCSEDLEFKAKIFLIFDQLSRFYKLSPSPHRGQDYRRYSEELKNRDWNGNEQEYSEIMNTDVSFLQKELKDLTDKYGMRMERITRLESMKEMFVENIDSVLEKLRDNKEECNTEKEFIECTNYGMQYWDQLYSALNAPHINDRMDGFDTANDEKNAESVRIKVENATNDNNDRTVRKESKFSVAPTIVRIGPPTLKSNRNNNNSAHAQLRTKNKSERHKRKRDRSQSRSRSVSKERSRSRSRGGTRHKRDSRDRDRYGRDRHDRYSRSSSKSSTHSRYRSESPYHNNDYTYYNKYSGPNYSR